MRANDYPRAPKGTTRKARASTCERCDLNVICSRSEH
jgi:hypothetical protein